MKKVLAIAAVATMIPFAAHAKSAITDSDMGRVTGQSGVSIDLDVRMDIKADTIAWGNSDGSGTSSWIGMKNFAIDNMTVKLRPDILGAVVVSTLLDKAGITDVILKGGYAAAGHTAEEIAAYNALVDGVVAARGLGATTSYFIAKAKPMTIDVATVPGVAGTDPSVGNKLAGTTYVSIGLGSLQIAADNIGFEVALGRTSGAAPKNTDLNQSLGFMAINKLAVNLNGSSTVDIYAYGQKASAAASTNPGVVFDLNVIIESLTASAVSWGNSAAGSVVSTSNGGGTSTTTSGGFIGMSNLAIGNMTLVGPVSIQVGTVPTYDLATAESNFQTAYLGAADAVARGQALSNYYYALYDKVNKSMGNSFVHFGIGTGTSTTAGSTLAANSGAFKFGIGSMTADIKVSPNADLSGGGTYGSFAMSNLQVGVNGWLNIGAH